MRYWTTGILLILADIVSKYQAKHLLTNNEVIIIIQDFFSFNLAFNEGVAFSLPIPRFLQILITIAFLIFFFIWAKNNFSKLNIGERLGSLFLVSGAIGNFIDRIFSGDVTDFISIYYYDIISFPIFNLADIFIFLGVVSWFLSTFFKKTEEKDNDEI